MKSFECTITDPMGLHARPAGLLAKIVGNLKSKITLSYNGKSVACNRMIAIMQLQTKQGDVVTLSAEGADEDADLLALKELCKKNM